MIVGKAQKLQLLARRRHQRSDGRLTANDLVFDLLHRKLVSILVRIQVIAKIKAADDPRLEHRSSLLCSKLLDLQLIDESRYRRLVPRQCCQDLLINQRRLLSIG